MSVTTTYSSNINEVEAKLKAIDDALKELEGLHLIEYKDGKETKRTPVPKITISG